MPGGSVALLAPAKVNLALHVTGRRPDGYHLLDTVAAFADFGDQVEIAPAERLSLRVSGPFAAHAPGDSRDLAWQAAEAFFAATGLPAEAAVQVTKNIPAGAGLAGGSADAAAVLRGLDRVFATALSARELAAIGLPLGADVPMCVQARTVRVRGVGEILQPLHDWPVLPAVLVWPGERVATAGVFKALQSAANASLPALPSDRTPVAIGRWLAGCRNDLEEPARRIAPVIGEALEALRTTPGCLLARMSGSGSACFALYGDADAARSAAEHVSNGHAGWWVRAASLGGSA